MVSPDVEDIENPFGDELEVPQATTKDVDGEDEGNFLIEETHKDRPMRVCRSLRLRNGQREPLRGGSMD